MNGVSLTGRMRVALGVAVAVIIFLGMTARG